MNNESYIRSEIRKYLLEYSNIGADNGEELEYSPESIEDLIAVAQQRKKDQEKKSQQLKEAAGYSSASR